MNEAITHDTLAGEWRRRMVARSTIGALLLAVPVMAAAAIGFSAGPGGLPFGISSIASGPGTDLPSGDGERPGGSDSISQLLGETSAATVVAAAPPASAAGGGSADGGGGGSTGGDGGSGGGAPVGTPGGGSTGGGSTGDGSTGGGSTGGGGGSVTDTVGGVVGGVGGGGGGVPSVPTVPNVPNVPGVGGSAPGAGGVPGLGN